MALYRENGIRFMDKKTILNIVAQSIFGLGMFKVLKRMEFSSKFLWIADLGKPDFLLTIFVGILMAVNMVLMPESTGHASMWLMIAVPVLISVVAVATLPSAIGIYWATSNVVIIGQTLAFRGLLTRRRSIQNTSNEKFSKI
jgi:YidC/Oxa1 family membrane protein insertase